MQITRVPSSLWFKSHHDRVEELFGKGLKSICLDLPDIGFISVPWSGLDDERGIPIKAQLTEMRNELRQRGCKRLISMYAGSDPEKLARRLSEWEITVMFSCYLPMRMKTQANQLWFPIAPPLELIPAGPRMKKNWRDCRGEDADTVFRIWQTLKMRKIPLLQEQSVRLPGNRQLWLEATIRNPADIQDQAKQSRVQMVEALLEENDGLRCFLPIPVLMSQRYSECIDQQKLFTLDGNNIALSSRHSGRESMLKDSQAATASLQIRLYEKGGHRTPLAYEDVLRFAPRVRLCSMGGDLTITGSVRVLNEIATPAACISEEPYWDVVYGGGTYPAGTTGYLDGFFDDLEIPYILAVNPLIRYRIAIRLAELVAAGVPALHKQLQSHRCRYVGMHAFRLGAKNVGIVDTRANAHQHGTEDLRALSGLRTKISIHARARGWGVIYGKGWGRRGFRGLRRDAYLDWHLQKLTCLKRIRPMMGMAMENIHCNAYISEKPFDMLALGIVPIVYAGTGHIIHKFISPDSTLNVHGQSLATALDLIERYEPSKSKAQSIIEDASRLKELLLNTAAAQRTLQELGRRSTEFLLKIRSQCPSDKSGPANNHSMID